MTMTGLLSWLVPGLGHVFIGAKRRGIVIMVTIAVTFWGGVAIGGIRSTVNPHQRRLWFMAQIGAGSHAVVAGLLGTWSRRGQSPQALSTSRWQSIEIAMVYTGIAGMLNLVVILDALARAEAPYRRREVEAMSAKGVKT